MKTNFKSYHLSDTALLNECSRIINCVNRDLFDFAKCNITSQHLLSLEKTMWQFFDLPTDDEMQTIVTAASENKDGIADLILRHIKIVQEMAERQWGSTDRYNAFGFETNTSLPDSDLLLMVKRMVRVSKRFFNGLATQGLTEEMLTDITALARQFSEAIDLQEALISDAVTNSRQRSMLANEMHNRLTSFTDTGKSMYEYVNETKYNDYILNYDNTAAELFLQTA